jgi:hypothetical protein
VLRLVENLLKDHPYQWFNFEEPAHARK